MWRLRRWRLLLAARLARDERRRFELRKRAIRLGLRQIRRANEGLTQNPCFWRVCQDWTDERENPEEV